MSQTEAQKANKSPSWVLFMFHLSSRKASKRVSVWRQLQKYGALNWKNCAYILPLSPSNLERFQWLAAEVQKYQGDSSVVEASRIHGCTREQVMTLFNRARAAQYERLVRDMRLALRAAASRSKAQQLLDFSRLNRRLTDANAIDFFDSEHSTPPESRCNIIGSTRRLLFVAYTELQDETIWLISARKAESKYRKLYEEENA